jgi:hypothetical protein
MIVLSAIRAYGIRISDAMSIFMNVFGVVSLRYEFRAIQVQRNQAQS